MAGEEEHRAESLSSGWSMRSLPGQILGVAPSLIEQMAEDQQIPHYKIDKYIRFDSHDLHLWVSRRRLDEVNLDVQEES